MTPAIERAQLNAGQLGQFVNVQMVCKAIFGRIPRRLPAPLEQVIDVVKDDRDLSPVKTWCERVVQQLARDKHPVPQSLLPRIEKLAQQPLTTSIDHWLDQLLADAQQHLNDLQQRIDALPLTCAPPLKLFDTGEIWQEQALVVHNASSPACDSWASWVRPTGTSKARLCVMKRTCKQPMQHRSP